jgi:hypothetical protein
MADGGSPRARAPPPPPPPRAAAAADGHDRVGLLAGTALSQPGQAVSQRRRAGRSPWPPMMEQLLSQAGGST